jgi:hypothetical protein
MKIACISRLIFAYFLTFTGSKPNTLSINGGLAMSQGLSRTSRRGKKRDGHRINATFAARPQPGAFLPTHHLQQLVPDIVIIFARILRWWRGGRRWRRSISRALLNRWHTLRKREVRLIMHNSAFLSTVPVLGLLLLRIWCRSFSR